MKSAQQLTEESSLPPSSLSSSSSQLALSSMWSEDACVVVLSHALSIAAPAPVRSHVTSLINAAYNCTDRCGTECENGGSVNANCKCVCGYGFEEAECDNFCSTYPETRTGAIFCQWLIRAPAGQTIEFYLKDLDLDADNVPPDQPCNDIFYIWGTKSIVNP
ncbi:unnamed protein product [Gongylonema pulchrum]|uniref:CUB domain-containing protein n=1 Tax=Gongylonema pulchrum TaxID=637853 RepID=A0A183EFP6_9BILA|nr:unnamed protein product [Gongylonema pulchrum]